MIMADDIGVSDDPTVDPAYGKVGRQTIENTGALDTKRMETVDEEFLNAALDFIDRQHTANTPWFCSFNPARMHVWTHLKPASEGKTGFGPPWSRNYRSPMEVELRRIAAAQTITSVGFGAGRAREEFR
jgi:arylsulfatase A-like enzyme